MRAARIAEVDLEAPPHHGGEALRPEKDALGQGRERARLCAEERERPEQPPVVNAAAGGRLVCSAHRRQPAGKKARPERHAVGSDRGLCFPHEQGCHGWPLAHGDAHAVREAGRDLDRAHEVKRGHGREQRAAVDVERAHAPGRQRQRAFDRARLRTVGAGHAHVAHRYQRGVAKPHPPAAQQRCAERERDQPKTQAPALAQDLESQQRAGGEGAQGPLHPAWARAAAGAGALTGWAGTGAQAGGG